jgi:serine/threonine protein kinase
MSVVYAARDPDSGQPVALKVVRPAIGSGEALRHAGLRMLREAWILSQVRDPNVVTVLDVVASGDEMFLVLELIEGTDLERWLCDARSGLAVPEGLGAPSAGLLMGTRNP